MQIDLTQIIVVLIGAVVAIMTHKRACETVPPGTAEHLRRSIPADTADALLRAVPQETARDLAASVPQPTVESLVRSVTAAATKTMVQAVMAANQRSVATIPVHAQEGQEAAPDAEKDKQPTGVRW